MMTSEQDNSPSDNTVQPEDDPGSLSAKRADTPTKDVLNEESSDSEKVDRVDMTVIDRASRAAKIARKMAQIKEFKSAYSSGTTIDLTDLTEDSDISANNSLTEDFPDSE